MIRDFTFVAPPVNERAAQHLTERQNPHRRRARKLADSSRRASIASSRPRHIGACATMASTGRSAWSRRLASI
jgi:hypothetical protein